MSVTFTSHKKKVEEAVNNALKVGLEACGMMAETYAKKNETAVDTGRLRNSITWATKDREGMAFTYSDDKGNRFDDAVGHGIKECEVYIGTNVEYAPYIENGARGRKPLHFLKNAAQNHSEEYRTLLENALRELG